MRSLTTKQNIKCGKEDPKLTPLRDVYGASTELQYMLCKAIDANVTEKDDLMILLQYQEILAEMKKTLLPFHDLVQKTIIDQCESREYSQVVAFDNNSKFIKKEHHGSY